VESLLLGAAAIAALFYLKIGGSDSSSNNISAGDESFPVDVESDGFYSDNNDMIYDISPAGVDALKKREGFSAKSYPDHKGRSIGYGHLIKPGESFSEPMSVNTATDLLYQDLQWAVASVWNAIQVPLTQNQFDALVSFVYNVGAPAFESSTLVKKINNLDPTATSEFSRWVNASGKRNESLVSRRESELNQFLA